MASAIPRRHLARFACLLLVWGMGACSHRSGPKPEVAAASTAGSPDDWISSSRQHPIDGEIVAARKRFVQRDQDSTIDVTVQCVVARKALGVTVSLYNATPDAKRALRGIAVLYDTVDLRLFQVNVPRGRIKRGDRNPESLGFYFKVINYSNEISADVLDNTFSGLATPDGGHQATRRNSPDYFLSTVLPLTLDVATELGNRVVTVPRGDSGIRRVVDACRSEEDVQPTTTTSMASAPIIEPNAANQVESSSTRPERRKLLSYERVPVPPPVPAAHVASGVNLEESCSGYYPTQSVQRREQGTVGLLIRVASNGGVTDARIETSSGSPRLDSAALACIQDQGRFIPPSGTGMTADEWQRFTWTWRWPTESDQ